jgi:hypothetical protein
MKYLKLFESYSDIESICRKYIITNYTINSDGSIDVDADVNLYRKRLTKLPLKFRNVSGNFDCSYNQLTKLVGSPESVGDNFYCNSNQLITLEGAPETVGESFDCSNNQLITLKGSPKSVGESFDCFSNKLTTLEGAPQSVGSNFDFRLNKLINFTGFPENFYGDVYNIGNPVTEIYNLFGTFKCIKWLNEFDVIQGDKVILDRLEEVYHQLGMEIPEKIELHNYEII